MQTVHDASYGVIPLVKDGDTWKVLLIHQISYRGDDFWTLPKGHAEEGETELAAAKRELEEETGVVSCQLDPARVFETSYTFTHEQQTIHKTVKFWLGYCPDLSGAITRPHEIKELRWCNFASAYTLLNHTNTKDVLKEVESYLQSPLASTTIRVE